MKRVLFVFITGIFFFGNLNAEIRHVPAGYATIQEAIDASADEDTVLVAPDVYYENLDFNGKCITLASYYLTAADSSYIRQTVIDGSAAGPVINLTNGEDSRTVISGCTIRNGYANSGAGIHINGADPHIYRCVIEHNIAESSNGQGGGIRLGESEAIVENCTIRFNSALGGDMNNGTGGGIHMYNSSASVLNCIITDNDATGFNAGISCAGGTAVIAGCLITRNRSHTTAGAGFQDTDVYFVNNTVAGNIASPGLMGGVYFIRSTLTLMNCIIWFNRDSAGTAYNFNGWGSTVGITYNNIQGGYNAQPIMDADPLFENMAAGNFRLSADSPCIDAGAPAPVPTATDLDGNYRVHDGDGDGVTLIDMGAYEYGSMLVDVKDSDAEAVPDICILEQNYPNPFNGETVITFSLPRDGRVTLTLFDIMGRKVAVLADGVLRAGTHRHTWNAAGLPSGVYLCRLISETHTETIRLLLQR